MNQQENTTTDENPETLSNFFACIAFAYKSSPLPIILTALFLVWVVIDWQSGWKVLDNVKILWNNELDQIVSLATLMIALFVWYGEIAQDWRNNLPKRLTVQFANDQGELVLQCFKAHLSDVADIRTLGQQIASQMCDNNRNLEFRAPYIKQSAGKILCDPEIGCFLLYYATFTFINLPEGLAQGQYKEWREPFKADDLKSTYPNT